MVQHYENLNEKQIVLYMFLILNNYVCVVFHHTHNTQHRTQPMILLNQCPLDLNTTCLRWLHNDTLSHPKRIQFK